MNTLQTYAFYPHKSPLRFHWLQTCESIGNIGYVSGFTDKILTDFYGVESSNVVDINAAVFTIIVPLQPLGNSKAGKVIDRVNTMVQFVNDAGKQDSIKTQFPIDKK
jgi:hypothetical protein